MMNEAPHFSMSLEITRRDVVCFLIAAGLHSFLFLWKGGVLQMGEDPSKSLGDMIVQVGYISEYPGGGNPGQSQQAGAGPGTGLLSRVKSFFSMPAPSTEVNTGGEVAVGASAQPLDSKPNWNKLEQTLSNKDFSERKSFKEAKPNDSIDVSKGGAAEALSAPSSQGNFKAEGTALKEKSFQVGTKDSPFKVVQPKTLDTLSNMNAVPVAVGGDTQSNDTAVKAVSGSDSVGPSIKSKELSSGGLGTKGGFGSRGAGGSTGENSGQNGAGMLAMGGGSGNSAVSVGGLGGNGAGGSGSDVGSYGNGSGSGYGGGGGTGAGSYGSGSGSKSWGGTGLGGTKMESLNRNVVPDQAAKGSIARSGDKDFLITGALAGRGISSKTKPAYDRDWDGRVALKFSVDWSGRVLDGIVIVISSGSPTFDQKVIAALKKWIFVPLDGTRTNEIQEGVITFIFRGV